MRTVHVIPLGDEIEHQVPGGIAPYDRGARGRWLSIEADPAAVDVDCPCGPAAEHIPPGGWLISHHSLDGREL